MKFLSTTEIIFADRRAATEHILIKDDYTERLSLFDIQSKTKNTANKHVDDYLEFATQHLYDWKSSEMAYMQAIIKETEQKIIALDLKFDLPQKLVLIKSAMHEEGNANGFTRGNYIVFNYKSLSSHLFEHELFHIISRYNPKRIEKAYRILGFTKCNEIALQGTLADLKITNPDAPFNNYYITVEHNGKKKETVLLIYAKDTYNGGRFFKYVNKGLLVVTGEENQKEAVLVEGTPEILEYDQVTNLFEQIGKNTRYNIHQEEVSADHFVMLINKKTGLPDQHLVDQLKKVFI